LFYFEAEEYNICLIIKIKNILFDYNITVLPNGDATGFVHSVVKPCQHAVGSPRNTPKNIIFASYSVYTTSSQRPYSVHTTFPQRIYSVHDVFIARKQLLQRVHGAHTARTQRSHDAHTASSRRLYSVAFKIFYLFYFTLSNPILQT